MVDTVTLRDFRSYASLDLALAPGIVLVTGENGAGKTNLLEAIHLGTQGFSPRTRTDGRLIRFGANAAAVGLRIDRDGVQHDVRVKLGSTAAKTAELDGSRLPSADSLRREFPTLVFTPDRLAVIKGGPAVRRAYIDRVIARLLPTRAGLPQDYAATLAQRSAALRRVQLGLSSRDVLSPWTERVAALGAELVEARIEATASLEPAFRTRLADLGLLDGALAYAGSPPTAAALEARLETDIARGSTGLGPHLDDLAITSSGRELRGFGSQGEQRLALLALLLAEASLLPSSPLLLLDDVLSELDSRRRGILAACVSGLGQTVITATHRSALPVEPSQIVEVSGGTAV
ncbi:MAG TPA: DNA replication and repair protein RecF [Gaiellaceae bacterium]